MQALLLSGSPSTQNRQGYISEIIVAGNALNHTQTDITFAMLAHLSHQYKKPESAGQWLTWICPTGLGKEALQRFDFDVLGLRILQPKQAPEIPRLMERALAAGNSHTVVVHCQAISHKRLARLERAASQGRCNGLIIRPQ
ncbi:hypothetical protein [Marinagarivorans algicola]|uniref:hypothetical protein n=1 Tax=Marinagarivorans algicola TaxID=1513270 RepID=UPI0006B62226|nr:hypothetical protein [Marinagarivorans algicola]